MFSVLDESIIGRAKRNNFIDIETIDIRKYTDNKHLRADDYPFGGGAGMVMMSQPIFAAFDEMLNQNVKPHTIYMSPKGKVFDQKKAQELSKYPHIAILCGHYEGVDQRVIDNLVDEEISIGDYVLTGGELPAMVLVDSIARLIPGVLGSDESAIDESHSDGLLEYPQYTRPAEFRGMNVPPVLISGHHANIEIWKRQQKLLLTAKNRPDLLEKADLTDKDRKYLQQNGYEIK